MTTYGIAYRLPPIGTLTIIDLVDDEMLGELDVPTWDNLEPLVEACPACGLPGLLFDPEFGAHIHDHCGYWHDGA